jgi:hypothetical protein
MRKTWPSGKRRKSKPCEIVPLMMGGKGKGIATGWSEGCKYPTEKIKYGGEWENLRKPCIKCGWSYDEMLDHAVELATKKWDLDTKDKPRQKKSAWKMDWGKR